MTLTVPSIDSFSTMGIEQRVPTKTSFPLAVDTGICKVDTNFLDSNDIHVISCDGMHKIFMFRVFWVDREATKLAGNAAKYRRGFSPNGVAEEIGGRNIVVICGGYSNSGTVRNKIYARWGP